MPFFSYLVLNLGRGSTTYITTDILLLKQLKHLCFVFETSKTSLTTGKGLVRQKHDDSDLCMLHLQL